MQIIIQKSLLKNLSEIPVNNIFGVFQGRLSTQSVIVTRFLDGDSKEDVYDEFRDVNQYCSGLKVLFNQLSLLKQEGTISDGDIREMRGSLERVNEMLKKVAANAEKNKMHADNIGIAAPELTRILRPAGFKDF